MARQITASTGLNMTSSSMPLALLIQYAYWEIGSAKLRSGVVDRRVAVNSDVELSIGRQIEF